MRPFFVFLLLVSTFVVVWAHSHGPTSTPSAPPTTSEPPTSSAPPDPCAPCLDINAAGKTLIKDFEGFVPQPAPDPIGLPTVGYGHKCVKPGCSEIPYPLPLTPDTASKLLNDDIKTYTGCLKDALCPTPGLTLNDNQWAALVSWTFNIGCAAMKGSTLIKRLKAGDDPNTVAGEELPKWNKAGGKVSPGLVRRRAAESTLFKTPSDKQAFPQCK